MKMKEEKKVIWITGGSSGIGYAVAKDFAKIGCKVYISGRRNTELERTVKEFEKEKLKIEAIPCNIASEANVSQVVKQIISKEKKIDCLVNNAGITYFKNFYDLSFREIKDVIGINLLGSIFCTKVVLENMIKNKSGTIFNISSVASKFIYKGSSVYSASKSGLNMFANVLREELREYGIRIINILPGPTETKMWSQEHRKNFSNRMMKPEDISQIIVSSFLQKPDFTSEEIVIRPITGDLVV